MKKTLLIAIAAVLLIGGTVNAQEERHTIVVKDGKIIQDGRTIEFDEILPGFPRAYLGVSLLDLTPGLREHFGTAKDGGVLVSDVAAGSPAEKAGIRPGDVIVSIDGKSVANARELRRSLREKKNGDSARVEVVRGRSRQALVATVVEREMPEIPGLPAGRMEELSKLSERLNEKFNSPEWRAHLERLGDCGDLQTRIRELEQRLKDLEKRLQK